MEPAARSSTAPLPATWTAVLKTTCRLTDLVTPLGFQVVRPRVRAQESLLSTALARRWPRFVALFALAALLPGFTALRGINLHDEGLMLQAAARLAHGQLPYRDFWWNYGPGQPLL